MRQFCLLKVSTVRCSCLGRMCATSRSASKQITPKSIHITTRPWGMNSKNIFKPGAAPAELGLEKFPKVGIDCASLWYVLSIDCLIGCLHILGMRWTQVQTPRAQNFFRFFSVIYFGHDESTNRFAKAKLERKKPEKNGAWRGFEPASSIFRGHCCTLDNVEATNQTINRTNRPYGWRQI